MKDNEYPSVKLATANDKQENTSILNLLSLWSSQSERKSLISSSAQSSRPNEHFSVKLATAVGSLVGHLIRVALVTATITTVTIVVAKLVWKLI